MSLTYSAIVVTYIPQIIKAVTERRAAVINEGSQRAARPAATVDSARTAPKRIGMGGVLLGLGALFLLAAALPILAGISNIIGLFIIRIALYEAWRLNKIGRAHV